MTMDDKQLKDIFNRFDPEMPSDFTFLSQLQRSLDAIEVVKQENISLRRRNRIAVAIAAAVGIVVGSLLTLLMPYFGEWMSTLDIAGRFILAVDFRIVGLLLVAAVSVIISVNAYELALARLKK